LVTLFTLEIIKSIMVRMSIRVFQRGSEPVNW